MKTCHCKSDPEMICGDCNTLYHMVSPKILKWLEKELKLTIKKSKKTNKPNHSEWVAWDSRKETLREVMDQL